jgi:hypothetical protein
MIRSRRMTRVAHIFAIIAIAASAVGCGEFRGIPTHGGGKRFDEEQRVIAGAIRQTVADMDLGELSGKRVAIVLDCVAQDGGGNVSFPGVNYMGAGINGNVGTGNLVQINQSLREGTGVTNDNSNQNIGGNAGVGIQPQVNYSTHAMSTSADAQYLRATLEMKALHAGLHLVNGDEQADAVLHVLIDVLGTNRSRDERIVSNSERLLASCEATYYAKDAKTGDLIFAARQVSAASKYIELRAIGVGTLAIARSIDRVPPTPLPVHSVTPPSTQPAVAKRKSFFETMLTGAGP